MRQHMIERVVFVAAALLLPTPASGHTAPTIDDQVPSIADQVETPDTATTDTTPPIQLAPLTVTVLRSSLDLERVPATVTVAEASTAARRGTGLGFDDLLHTIPGLQVDNRYNYSLGERISIRGFGARPQFGVRGIRVIVDGIPATLPDGQSAIDDVDLSGVGRAEVLHGPASSLYGNAAGGVIQLESQEPPSATFAPEMRTVAGSDGLLRLEGRVGGEVGRFWYGVEGTRLTFDGYREYNAADNLWAGARMGYRGERDDVRFTLRYVDLDAENPGALSESLLEDDRWQAFGNNVQQQTGKRSSQLLLGTSWRRSFDHGSLEVAGYRLGREVENPIPPQIIDIDRAAGGARIVYHGNVTLAGERSGTATVATERGGRAGVDDSAASRDISWTVGIEADRQRDDRLNHTNEDGVRGDLSLDQLEWVTGVGAFGQLMVPVTARLSAQGGLRYDTFRFRARDRFTSPDDEDDDVDLSGARTMAALSPSVGVIYAPVSALSVYANFSTSFQTPSTTELANRPEGAGGFNPSLEPERTRSFETGVRGRVADRTSYQVAAYHARTRNALIGFEVPAMPGRTFYRNAGSAVHRGIEAEASMLASDAIILRLAYALTDARFDQYQTDDAVMDGMRVPGIARHRVEGNVIVQAAGLSAELRGRTLAKVPADDANTASAPAYTLFNARVEAETIQAGGLAISPFVGIDNIFDRNYITSLAINAFGGRYFEPGPGRSFFAGVRVGFGGR